MCCVSGARAFGSGVAGEVWAGGSGTVGFGPGGVRGGAAKVPEVLASTDGGSES